MKLFLSFLMLFSISIPAFADVSPTLIGGRYAQPDQFPETIYIRAGGSRCSASVVGPRTILTAAHCVADQGSIQPAEFQVQQTVFQAICSRHPGYETGTDVAMDFALCKTRENIDVKYAQLAKYSPKEDEQVTLSGYGCTREGGGGGNDGRLKYGEAPVVQEGEIDGWFYTRNSDGALCFGDSGGPAYKFMESPEDEVHYQIGVNSRGNIKDLSLLSAVFVPKAWGWIERYAEQNGVEICGVTRDCFEGENGPKDPKPDPKPEPWRCKRYRKKVEKYEAKVEKYQRKADKYQGKYDQCMQESAMSLEILPFNFAE